MIRLIPLMVLMLAAPSIWAGSTFAPPPGKTILFIGQDLDSINAYLTDLPLPAGFMSYTSLENLEGLSEPRDHGGGLQHAQPLLNKYPGMAWQLGLYMVGQLEATAEGRNDAEIDRLGAYLKAANRPVFLRIGYEFDLPANRYEPTAYVAAYRRIVDRFRKNGVTNVAFVWHSYAHGDGERMKAWYPGDDYVDWMGASYFNQFPKFLTQAANLADELKKPLMLAETSSWYIKSEPARKAFFERMFKFIENRQVGALCYINAHWDAQPMWETQKWGDGRVQPYPDVLALWKAETSRPRYRP